jgi:MFS family permease
MRRIIFGQRASFFTSAAVVADKIWTSAAPALTYPLYAQNWNLTTFDTTAIFAVYPIFVVSMLVIFGNISDYIGRREAMLIGLAFSALGSALFAMAPNVSWIFVGRALMGIGVGLLAGPSAAAVVEFSAPDHADKAGGVTAGAQAVGMAGAVLIGGASIEYAPLPTRLNFITLTLLLLVLMIATRFLPNRSASRPPSPWRPRVPSLPNNLIPIFAAATASVTASYVLGAMTLSLGAQVARDVVASSNALVNGGTIAVFAAFSGRLPSWAGASRPGRSYLPERPVLLHPQHCLRWQLPGNHYHCMR